MAQSGKSKTKSKSKSAQKKNNKNCSNNRAAENTAGDSIKRDITLCIILCLTILLFISNLGFGGVVGNAVSSFFFGIFGIIAYIFPFLIFFGIAFYYVNRKNALIVRKLVGGALFVLFFCVFMELVLKGYDESTKLIDYYIMGAKEKSGGGFIGGALMELFALAFGVVGAYVLTIIGLVVSAIIMTQRPLISKIHRKSREAYREAVVVRKRKKAAFNIEHTDLKKNQEKKQENEKQKIPDDDYDVSKETKRTEEKPESIVDIPLFIERGDSTEVTGSVNSGSEKITVSGNDQMPVIEVPSSAIVNELKPVASDADAMQQEAEAAENAEKRSRNPRSSKAEIEHNIADIRQEILSDPPKKKKVYKFPPYKLLEPAGRATGDSDEHLRETAAKLQQTLRSFGVGVTVTNASCGPTVTRYELQPDQGVKVSNIVSRADDIKLNLAATDIRIEAPIPGKAAIGIEVPNQENAIVRLRELLQSDAFVHAKSALSFAVGKDIAGKPVITDIAKMPHLLIAGATGSGKSVCINSLIISLLYKANPDDMKLILIDPKVVELSAYNGIPHLLIPVVTDPKKAAGALNWAVAEMTERYNKFAEYNVRDLKSFNEKAEILIADPDIQEEEKPKKLPQIVIVVDELADLMMVAPGEVEDAICRLAQLARAAGIHLIIATQRPSVNVITGLIKANMPSRIAFAVSSGVDSRTILDMNGAEKLLGNGDMLFYPQGYPKPVRLQGALVTDKEVAAVVKFLASQQDEVVYNKDIESKIISAGNGSHNGAHGAASYADEKDAYFAEAGRFIIEKDKASIGMLQRVFKIGFNRAARIMDQLCEAGVVGEEEGTKPRKVLMSMEQFEQVLEEM